MTDEQDTSISLIKCHLRSPTTHASDSLCRCNSPCAVAYLMPGLLLPVGGLGPAMAAPSWRARADAGTPDAVMVGRMGQVVGSQVQKHKLDCAERCVPG